MKIIRRLLIKLLCEHKFSMYVTETYEQYTYYVQTCRRCGKRVITEND